MLVLLLLGGLVAIQGLAINPPPGITPAEVGSAYACYPSCILPNYIIAEDLDSDGWLDLAVSCFGNSQVWTYENIGSPLKSNLPGVFATPLNGFGGPIGVPLGPIALASGTFNAIDGYPDVGVLSSIPSRVSGLQFSAAPAPAAFPPPVFNGAPVFLAPTPVVHMAVGDFDRADGLSDVVIADKTPALSFYTSVVAAAPIPILLAAAPTFVVVADFDQNGWDDVAVSCDNNTVEVYYMPGSVPLAPVYLGAITPTSMDVADFNNDGFPDIVVVGNAGGSGFAQVLLNSVIPTGFTSLPAQPTWGTGAHFVEAFDADGNGWTDFAVANYASHTVTVFLTQPGNTTPVSRNTRPILCLTPKAAKITVEPKFKYELQCGFYPTGIAAGDFDRNGKMDMAISLYSATLEINPQVPSCIEVIFDVACGLQPNQLPHRINPEFEPQACEPCIDGPCAENSPPSAGIQTGSDSKN
jgi:hypothetical protein